MQQRWKRGFTLIELLMVVAIIGILAMIAIPNLLNALGRAKQRRTMGDMRQIATAWEARATDANRYNASGLVPGITAPIGANDLAVNITPTYLKVLPRKDGWGRDFAFYGTAGWGTTQPSQGYAIVSGGSDQIFQDDSPAGAFSSFDCDIIFSNGAFYAYPEGVAGGAPQQ